MIHTPLPSHHGQPFNQRRIKSVEQTGRGGAARVFACAIKGQEAGIQEELHALLEYLAGFLSGEFFDAREFRQRHLHGWTWAVSWVAAVLGGRAARC